MKTFSFWTMVPNNSLVKGPRRSRVLAEPGVVYVIQFPDGVEGGKKLDLTGYRDASFSLQWFDPRSGQRYGGGTFPRNCGWCDFPNPPDSSPKSDWILVVRKD